jgi:hypothetical protein
MKRLRPWFSYANVVASLALFLALTGTAFAASQMLPKNSVGAKQLKMNAVTPAKLSASARSALQGPSGPSGPAGPAGPAGPTGATGPAGVSGTGPAFGVFQQGVVELGASPMTVVTLPGLPAGSYAITATALEFSGSAETALVNCELVAGGASGSGEPPNEVLQVVGNQTPGSAGASDISLQLLHTFTADGGTVTLSCVEETVTNRVEVSGTRIHAVRVLSASSIAG